MDEEWKLESTTDTACKLPHVERRQRTLNNDHSPPPWEELEDRMETPQEKQPVRWKSDNEESGRPFRDNIVVEGVNLEWNIGGEKEDRVPPGRDARDSYGDESQKAQKIEDRQKGRHPCGATAEYSEYYGNHFTLRTRRPKP